MLSHGRLSILSNVRSEYYSATAAESAAVLSTAATVSTVSTVSTTAVFNCFNCSRICVFSSDC